MSSQIIKRSIGGKTAAWLPEANKYVLADPAVLEVAGAISAGHETREVIDICMDSLGLPRAEAVKLEREARSLIFEPADERSPADDGAINGFFSRTHETSPFSVKYYNILGVAFCVSFHSARAEFVIHPRLSHLETRPVRSADHSFGIHHRDGWYGLLSDGHRAGIWPEKAGHTFTGQFFMKLLEKAYGRGPDGWMAVFHAAAVACGDRCLMFAGRSGAGKSTLSALLLAREFDVLADDFLPVEGGTGLVCCFPAAISVKKQALDLLSAEFPELAEMRTYRYAETGKTVRYLPPFTGGRASGSGTRAACFGLVFVDHRPDSGFKLEAMAPETAFARLVPDTWIYPSGENAARFLDWFAALTCYRLTYSDSARMAAELGALLRGGPAAALTG